MLGVVEVEGLHIAYERVGSGSPIVLVHGYVGDGPSTWRPQIDSFAGEYTVVAWDAPGAGGSSDPPAGFGMSEYADCLARFIEALDLTKPHLVGLSFGGAMVIELCRRHRGLAATATLAGAYAGWAGSLPSEEVDRRLREALRLAELAPSDLVETLLPTMFSDSVPSHLVDAYSAALAGFHPAGLRAMARASAGDLRPALASIEIPVLLIYGVKDTRAPRSVADHMYRSIPGSTLVLLSEAGHVCNIDAIDEFNSALREFLHQHPNTPDHDGEV